MPASSSAAFSCTCCRAASTASATTACSPARFALTTSSAPDTCSPRPRPRPRAPRPAPTATLSRLRPSSDARVAAAGWSLSRRSKGRAPRDRRLQAGSGSTPHDRRRASRVATSIAFTSSRAPEQDGDVLAKSEDPLHALLSSSSIPSARSNKRDVVLPIDTIFGLPLQGRRRRSVRDPQIPIGRSLPDPSSPRFPPWEAFERRPQRLASPSQTGRRPKPFT